MKKRGVTMKMIAEKVGISQMTVSRALRGLPGVSTEVRDYIKEVSLDLGYVPCRSFYDLGKKNSPLTVGLVMPHLANTIFPDVIQSLEQELSDQGYNVLLCCNHNDLIKEFRDISILMEREPDGIIWAPLHVEKSRHAAELVVKQKCPLVFLDRTINEIEADSVVVDDYEGAKNAVSHLIGLGRKRIAFLRPKQESSVVVNRERGFLDAMQEAGMTLYDPYVVRIGSDVASGKEGVSRLLDLPERPDAIFCFNDPLAIGVEIELVDRGVKIPEEIALVGFSDVVECQLAGVPITTVFQDAQGLGKEAAKLLLKRMFNREMEFKVIQRVLKTHLIERESTMGKSNTPYS